MARLADLQALVDLQATVPRRVNSEAIVSLLCDKVERSWCAIGKDLGGWREFLGMILEYNVHDYSLSGSGFRNNTPFKLTPNPLRNIYQVGFMYFKIPFRVHVLLNNSSAYIEGQRYNRHPFLNISMSYLF